MSLQDTFDKLDGATRGCHQALDDLQFVIDKRLDELRAVVVERNRLIKERDALRRFVGELEYYIPRWDGISQEVREWLRDAVHRLNVDVVA